MTTDNCINIKIHRNDSVLNNISEPVELNNKNWSNFAKSLKTIQKDVNAYLTELVEQEKSAGDNVNLEEECEESSDEDEDESPKRKLQPINEKSRKKVKI